MPVARVLREAQSIFALPTFPGWRVLGCCRAGIPQSFSSTLLFWGNTSSPPSTTSPHFFGDAELWFLVEGEQELAGEPLVWKLGHANTVHVNHRLCVFLFRYGQAVFSFPLGI